MKRVIFTLVCLTIFFAAKAQSPCTVNPADTTDGVSPTSLNAVAEVAYNQVVQFKFPKDTTVTIFGNPQNIHVDSVGVDSVKHFPSSFGYQCGKPDCFYKGGQPGCVLVKGNPTSGQIGTYTLMIYFTGYVTFTSGILSGQNTSIQDSGAVKLTISKNSGIFYGMPNPDFEVGQNYPNPFNDNTEIEFNSPKELPATLTVRNELGQTVNTVALQAATGDNTYTFRRNGLPQGVYFYSIQCGENLITRRMVVKD